MENTNDKNNCGCACIVSGVCPCIDAPAASAAPSIDTPELWEFIEECYAGYLHGPLARSDRANAALIAHIDQHVAAAVEKVREELEAAHSRALTLTEMESRNAGYAEACTNSTTARAATGTRSSSTPAGVAMRARTTRANGR